MVLAVNASSQARGIGGHGYGCYRAPAHWYYCPSYGAYYPNVASCPEAWETVPAS